MEDKPTKRCCDCIHYEACAEWNSGFFQETDALGCDIFETVLDFAASYLDIDEMRDVIEQETLLKRRKKLFEQLGDVINDKENRGKLILYIMELWKYIADVHGENICIEIEEDGDG